MSLELVDVNSMSIIFEFLHFKDAINICYLNKECYTKFLIFCYRFSFVPLNFKKQENIHYRRSKDPKDFLIKHGFELFTTFCETNGSYIKTINIFEQIRYANCINNINNISKIAGFIPNKLKYISFDKYFNTTWDKKILPDSVESITFHDKCKFNYNIGAINLPSKLKKISFGYMFDKSIDDLPDTVEVISFCHNSRFNQYIHKFPKKLREIYFGNYYAKPMHKIPPGVKIIYFSNNSIFNEEIQYPQHIEKIFFGRCYDRNISDLLQFTNIISIKFHINSEFNHPIVEISNKSLENIYFGIKYNNDLDLSNCTALVSIRFHNKSWFNNILYLPNYIQYLYLGKNFNNELNLPNSIKLTKFPHNAKFKNKIIYDPNNFKGEIVFGKKY